MEEFNGLTEFDEAAAKLCVKLTKKLLHHIAIRLSGRDDCKSTEYIVHISVDEQSGQNLISMSPDIYVYPSRHERAQENRINVLEFVLKTFVHPSIYLSNPNGGVAPQNSGYLTKPVFVPGDYKYILSVDGKRRKWVHM